MIEDTIRKSIMKNRTQIGLCSIKHNTVSSMQHLSRYIQNKLVNISIDMRETAQHAMGFYYNHVLCVVTDFIPKSDKQNLDAHTVTCWFTAFIT